MEISLKRHKQNNIIKSGGNQVRESGEGWDSRKDAFFSRWLLSSLKGNWSHWLSQLVTSLGQFKYLLSLFFEDENNKKNKF